MKTPRRTPPHRPSGRLVFPGVRPRPAAFSLLELLITLALMIVLFTMYFSFGSRSHQRDQKLACQKNLQKIFVALQIYGNDFHGAFPVKAGAATAEEPLNLLVPQYTVDTGPFICPGSKDISLPAGESIAKRKISYAYVMGRRATDSGEVLMTDRQVDASAKGRQQLIFSPDGKAPGNNHHRYGGNYLFGDGHLEMSDQLAAFPINLPPGVVLLNPKP